VPVTIPSGIFLSAPDAFERVASTLQGEAVIV
jgi:hypothetical protein